MPRNILLFIISSVLLFGCGQSQQFAAIPSDIDAGSVPSRTIEMTAARYYFSPDVIRVKAGTLVHLKIKATEGTHGFMLGAFGIDERIDEDSTRIVDFYASKRGEYGFKCSHFCGIGHLGMTGKIIVE